jgi:hypothetical protein
LQQFSECSFRLFRACAIHNPVCPGNRTIWN